MSLWTMVYRLHPTRPISIRAQSQIYNLKTAFAFSNPTSLRVPCAAICSANRTFIARDFSVHNSYRVQRLKMRLWKGIVPGADGDASGDEEDVGIVTAVRSDRA